MVFQQQSRFLAFWLEEMLMHLTVRIAFGDGNSLCQVVAASA